jgi:acetoin utilization deacetylase AcuC-like enzyme
MSAHGQRCKLFLDEPSLREHNAVRRRRGGGGSSPLPAAILDVPARVEGLLDAVHAMRRLGAVASVDVARSASSRELLRHGACSASYLAALRDAVQRAAAAESGWVVLDADQTSVATEFSLQWALRSAGCAMTAARAAWDTRAASSPMRAFALSRPPGHHNGCTERVESEWPIDEGTRANHIWACHGGCLLNNVALAVHDVRDAGLRRCAIVDFDAHFGDGTLLHFRDDPGVFTLSVHENQSGMYPFFQGSAEENSPTNVNLPLATGSGDAAALAALRSALGALREFEPEMLFVACGFDALAADSSSTLCYTAEGYARLVSAIIDALPDIPIAAVLEGGYVPAGVASAFEAVVRVLGSTAASGQ